MVERHEDIYSVKCAGARSEWQTLVAVPIRQDFGEAHTFWWQRDLTCANNEGGKAFFTGEHRSGWEPDVLRRSIC